MFRNLEKHVCDLKWSQRMKEIGIRQDTYFQWVYDKKNDIWEVTLCDYFDESDEDEIHCAAYTVQDFVDIFPKLFRFARDNGCFLFKCEYVDLTMPVLTEDKGNLANIFARFLVRMTKNKDELKSLNND